MTVLAVAPTPTWYLLLGALLFTIGGIGLLVRRNPLVMFMCIELMLNAVNLTFVVFSHAARRHRAARPRCSSCSWSPPPRSSSASASSCRSCVASPGATADDIAMMKG